MARPKRHRAAAGYGTVDCHLMADSTVLLKEALCSGCWQALRQRLAMDGYLLLRGVLPVQDVLEVLCWPHQSANLHEQLCQKA